MGLHPSLAHLALAAFLLSTAGCRQIETFEWDEARVLCATSIDDRNVPNLESLRNVIEAAPQGPNVVLLYGHVPGGDMRLSTLDAVLRMGRDASVPFLTYPDMLPGQPRRAGIALSLDDESVADWFALRDRLAEFDARLTFFISNYHRMTDEEREQLHQLEAEGHAIEYHGTHHVFATDYVEEHGLDAYMADEFWPDLERMRADGFAPTSFAYPHGDRNDVLDQALLQEMHFLRSTVDCP